MSIPILDFIECPPWAACALRNEGEGEGEVAFFSAKRWDRRNRADLIESATPCHDAQVVGLYWDSNPLRLTILAAMSEDYTTAPQHLQLGIELSAVFSVGGGLGFGTPVWEWWCVGGGGGQSGLGCLGGACGGALRFGPGGVAGGLQVVGGVLWHFDVSGV